MQKAVIYKDLQHTIAGQVASAENPSCSYLEIGRNSFAYNLAT
jgi:hypothetical protein